MANSSTGIASQDNIHPRPLEAMIEDLGKPPLDGDEALQILHSHFEGYTEAEAKVVCRRIDWRLIPIMLTINTIQLVDKTVRAAIS